MIRMVFTSWFLLVALSSHGQRLQGGFKVNFGKTFLNETASEYDHTSFRLEGLYSPGVALQLNYTLGDHFDLTSGLGMQYRKLRFTQEKIHFADLASGTTYIRLRFSAIELPVLLRYKINLNDRSLLVVSAGIAGSLFRIQNTAIGFNDLRYVGADSLFYDIKGGGSMKQRLSADPFVSLGYEMQKDDLKVFGVNVFYQYTTVLMPQIEFHSSFYNKSASFVSKSILNGNLAHAGLSVIYYPSFLSFRKGEEDDAYEEME